MANDQIAQSGLSSLSVIYYSAQLFSVVIDLIFDGKVNLTREVIIDIIVVSVITGTAGGLGSWIFAKIDERKARKSSRSDTE
ncbi:hypothetical protein [Enterobacter asburiae]|uniref:hypothetical protein n=1 Tax=Enterobacter asburiae TaxID=61645 RepID=UPI0029350E77|nr:hypothetical protein [Enterobacter asburiae]MDV2292554.1 hypothetical protein [Enterobacter asburiae]